MTNTVLQIGAGGVGGVVAHKMAMNREVFSRIVLASRTLSKCREIADSIKQKGYGEIEIDVVDADNVNELVALIEKYKPYLVVNVALPYQDLAIMEACFLTKTHYLDTANYEHPDSAHFEYKEQWAYDTRYKEAGIFGLLGSGFDPGVTNVFCAYAQKHYFDEIHTIDILDCNAGDHGYAFATNFNPEINLREVSSKARYWVRNSLDSACSDFCGNPSPRSLQRMSNTLHSQGSDNPQNSSTILESNMDSNASHSLKSSQPTNLTQDTRILDSADSNKRDSNIADSTSLESNLALNKDLRQDSIYRKFEREEKHFKLESNTQKLTNESYMNGQWRDVAPLALMKEWDYPEVGVKNSYLLYHEELESLIRNIRGLRKIRFFMTFGESYLTHMKCLENIGFLRVDEVMHNGQKIVPIQVLKTLLPDPASLASRTKGETNIGCYITGLKDGKERTIYIYNVCKHEECYREVNAQGVSYTTGVPAMIGAKLICQKKWGINSVKNSSLGNLCGSSTFSHCDARQSASHSLKSSQPTNLTQDTRILDSNEIESNADSSVSDSAHSTQQRDSSVAKSTDSKNKSLESFIQERMQMNADMPQGGEFQGIDNGAKLYKKQNGTNADSIPSGSGVWNMEQNDPDAFMLELNKQGLPYVVLEIDSKGNHKVLEDGRK